MSLNLPDAVRWSADGRAVDLLDQRRLPETQHYLRLEDATQVAEAIRARRVHGQAAVSLAAALGLALDSARHTKQPEEAFLRAFDAAYCELRDVCAGNRPAALALERLRRLVDTLGGEDPGVIACRLYGEATALLEGHRVTRRRLGEAGYALLPAHGPVRVLTVGGTGTALAPVYHAVEQGRRVHVYVCETRPQLEGSRVLAWELMRAGVQCTVVIDAAAPLLLRLGAVDVVLAGAERIATNGDAANTVGTYSLAVHASHAGVPFYIVAAQSAVDAETGSGHMIEMEQSAPDEVRRGFGALTAPADVPVFAPSFDITPVELISAFVTESGVRQADALTDAAGGGETEAEPGSEGSDG